MRKVIAGHEKYCPTRCGPARGPRNPRVARVARRRAEARRAGAGRPAAPRAWGSMPSRRGVRLPFTANTPYINTIRPTSSRRTPATARSSAASRASSAGTRWRWSCAPTASRGRHRRPHLDLRLGGHAVRGRLQPLLPRHATTTTPATSIYFQGHASPGIYARAFLEGRLTDEQLENFRRELRRGGGLSSYPHPWLMPDFWEFPTVSMGLGPIMAIYQARFNRYLEDRGLKPKTDDRRSGRSSATARPTSRSRSAPSRWRRARSSTT